MSNFKLQRPLPTTWDEMTPDDWQQALRQRQHLVDQDATSIYSVGSVRTATAIRWLRLRGIKPRLNSRKYVEQLARLADSLDWLWTAGDDGTLSLTLRTTRQLMPSVSVAQPGASKHVVLCGPKSHGEDIAFGEFRQAIQHIRAWEADRNETALMALAGLLYRPAADTPHSTPRQPYDADTIEAHIARGRAMTRWQRWGAYAWMAYFCEFLTSGTFIIEGREVSFAPLFAKPAENAGQQPGASLYQVALTLAESHVFGSVADVDRTPLLGVMQKMLMDHERLQRIRRFASS